MVKSRGVRKNRQQKTLFEPILPELKNNPKRIIAHLDMDAFFASVEERDRPYLSGRPIVVGSDPNGGRGRGVVSTANYLARKYGIRSAIPISRAWQLAKEAKKRGEPEVIFLSTNFHAYETTSERIGALALATLLKNGADSREPILESAGIDEMYLDLSFAGSFAKARKIATAIKLEIKKQEKLTCSIGLGPNKLIAKIASDFKKPDGLTVVETGEAGKFIEQVPLRSIPGIGPKADLAFKKRRISSVAKARELSLAEMIDIFGKFGHELFGRLRGIDLRPIEVVEAAKSIGQHETLPEDSNELGQLLPRIEEMARKICVRLKTGGFQSFKTAVLTVRFSDFTTKTRSKTFTVPTDSEEALEKWAVKTLLMFLDKRENKYGQPIRLVGLRIEHLS
ncbi:MAG: DNA polymerase IV [Candidatus Paceibacterota bacterium]